MADDLIGISRGESLMIITALNEQIKKLKAAMKVPVWSQAGQIQMEIALKETESALWKIQAMSGIVPKTQEQLDKMDAQQFLNILLKDL